MPIAGVASGSLASRLMFRLYFHYLINPSSIILTRDGGPSNFFPTGKTGGARGQFWKQKLVYTGVNEWTERERLVDLLANLQQKPALLSSPSSFAGFRILFGGRRKIWCIEAKPWALMDYFGLFYG
jgi:hypothetical protein